MRRWLPAALIVLAVVALFGSPLFAEPAQPAATGEKAPELKLKTADGTEVSLSSYLEKKNVLLMFLGSGGTYTAGDGKLSPSARPIKRLYYEDRLAGYDAQAIVICPGPFKGEPGDDKEIALTLHDPDGKAYAAYGLKMAGEGKGAWATYFIDKKGVIRLRYLPFDRTVQKQTGRDHADLLDIYADIEKELGLDKTPAAKVARFKTGVSPDGYAGCTGLQIWPRYDKPDSLADKQTAFVQSGTAGEFVLIQFQDIVGAKAGQVPAGAKVHKAYLRLATVNHASTQKVRVHRMTTPWDGQATFRRSTVKDGQDVPWAKPGLGDVGANFEAEPVGKDYQVPVNFGDVQWDVTPAVQDWIDGKPNCGLAILAEKSKTPEHACFAMPPFFRPDQRPELVVSFTPKEQGKE